MIDVQVTVFLIASFVLGLVASLLAFHAQKHSISENKEFIHFYSLATLILVIGFFVHTNGDFFSVLYNNEDIGHILESIAHVILFISFLLYALSANKIMKTSKQYWFK